MSITVHRRANSFETPPAWVREERRPSPSCIAASTQLPLPIFGRSLQHDSARFAHPAEAEFARLLTWYRIRWVYEPTAFAIGWAEDGTPIRAFRPDFYLPDERMYVELTVMRQPLVTRKNRKLRLLRELYPSVRIKLLYRRDMERLRAAYDAGAATAPSRRFGEIVASEQEIADRARSLAQQISDEWLREGLDRELAPLVLAANRGALWFSTLLQSELDRCGIAVGLDRLQRSRYRPGASARQIRIARSGPLDLAGRKVLLVEDAVSTGLSASATTEWIARQGATDWRVCSLLDRRPARLLDLPLDWAAFEAPDQPLAGFGLSLHPQFGDLSCIVTTRDH